MQDASSVTNVVSNDYKKVVVSHTFIITMPVRFVRGSKGNNDSYWK